MSTDITWLENVSYGFPCLCSLLYLCSCVLWVQTSLREGILRLHRLRLIHHTCIFFFLLHQCLYDVLMTIFLLIFPTLFGFLSVFKHFIEHEGEQLIIGREQLHQFLFFNLGELFNLLLRTCFHSVDVYVKQAIIEDIAHSFFLRSLSVYSAHRQELVSE